MAQTVAQIKDSMTVRFVSDPNIITAYDLDTTLTFEDQFSVVSIESIFFYIVAFAIWTLQVLFDEQAQENKDLIASTKYGRVRWYVTMAKKFQIGYDLVTDEDYYDNMGLTQAQIDASMIVKYAAAEESNKGIHIKVATLTGGDLAPLSIAQLAAFSAYMNQIKVDGTRLFFVNNVADSFKSSLRIYFDPLILDNTGARLDGTAATPVQDAVNNFLKNLPFNGLFVTEMYVDALQAVEGVVIPTVDSVQARFGALPYQNIDVEYKPDAGYLRLTNTSDLTIQFLQHAPI